MSDKSFVEIGTFVGMVTSVLLFANFAAGQDTANPATPPVSAAEAACFSGPARLSEADVQAFLNAPSGLLTDFPSGGLPLSTRVRSLAGSDASTLDPLLSLVSGASSMQVAAIGSGLARVAKACERINPEYAAAIQEKIASLGNSGLELAFETASNETQTAAVGQAAGVGGGAVGAAGIGGGGAAGGGANGSAGSTAATGTSSGSFSTGSGGFTTSANGDNGDDVSTVIN